METTSTQKKREITKIEVQKNDDQRANVYLNGEFGFGVHQQLILDFGLHSGMELSVKEQQEIEAADAVMKAKAYALDYLAHKQRTEGELRDRLLKRDFSPSLIDDVVDRMRELSYLDDEQYAMDYVTARFSNRGYGPHRIRRELREKGVEDRFIEEALAQLDADEVMETARQHARKKWSKIAPEEHPQKKRRKLHGYLHRRGFSYDTIRQLQDELMDG